MGISPAGRGRCAVVTPQAGRSQPARGLRQVVLPGRATGWTNPVGGADDLGGCQLADGDPGCCLNKDLVAATHQPAQPVGGVLVSEAVSLNDPAEWTRLGCWSGLADDEALDVTGAVDIQPAGRAVAGRWARH